MRLPHELPLPSPRPYSVWARDAEAAQPMLNDLLDALDRLFLGKTAWAGMHAAELLCCLRSFAFSSDILCRWAPAVLALRRRVDQLAGER